MKVMIRYIVILLSSYCLTASAQNGKYISGNFTGFRFPQLVHEIETQTPYHIFYDSTDTDSLEIKLVANELSLNELLDTVFKNTDIHYALGTGNEVFVTKRYK